MNVDSTPENLAKVAALMKAIKTGKVSGKVVRKPMPMVEIDNVMNASRSTLYRWEDGKTMPVDSHFEEVASKLLHVPTARLQEYFDNKITLADLFKPQVKQSSPQEVVRLYQGLTDRDKYVVLAQLLEEQAKSFPFKNDMLVMQKLNNASVVSHQGSGSMPDEISGFGAMCLRDFINERLRQAGGFEALAENLRVFVSEQNLQIIQLFLEGSGDVDLSEMGNFLGAIAYGMQLLGFTDVTPEVLNAVSARSRESHLSC